MRKYKEVPVSVAKGIAEKFSKSQVVILAFDKEHSLTHTTTYGVEPFDKENAAACGEIASKAIGCDLLKAKVYEDFHADYSPAESAKQKERLQAIVDKIEALNGSCAIENNEADVCHTHDQCTPETLFEIYKLAKGVQ